MFCVRFTFFFLHDQTVSYFLKIFLFLADRSLILVQASYFLQYMWKLYCKSYPQVFITKDHINIIFQIKTLFLDKKGKKSRDLTFKHKQRNQVSFQDFLILLGGNLFEGQIFVIIIKQKLLKTCKLTMSNQINPISTQSSTQQAPVTKISNRQMKGSKLIEPQHQLSSLVSRFNEKMQNLSNEGANQEQSLRDECSNSKETTSTTLGGSRISDRESNDKSLEKINLQLQITASERVQTEVDQNPGDLTVTHQNKKKRGKKNIKNKEPIKEDNSNSHHGLAIEDSSNNSCLTDQQNSIVGQDYLRTVQDRDMNPHLPTIQRELSLVQRNRKRFQEGPSSIRIKTLMVQQKIVDYENFKFSYRNQRVLPEIRCLSNSHFKEFEQILCVSINFDPQYGPQDRKGRQKYLGTLQSHRIKQLCRRIRHLMRCEVDVILLQQVYSKQVRNQLLNTIKQFNKEGNVIYSYPQNLEYKDEFITTMILTKHNANFGQLSLSFKIKNPETKEFMPFPQQAFCEFNAVINGKEETICFLSCHFKSNRKVEYSEPFSIIRKNQIEYVKDFGKLRRYDRFIVIGDTNMGDGNVFERQNLFLSYHFCDAVNYGLSEEGGSFYFVHESKSVTNERLDRVLVDLKSAGSTLVQIKYIDMLLKSCKNKNLDIIETLVKDPKNFQQIRLTDHSILEIRIRFPSQ